MTTVIPASARMLAVSTPAMRAGQHYLNLPIVVLFIMSSSGCPNSAGTEDEHRGSAA
jgi:hypothetical protein